MGCLRRGRCRSARQYLSEDCRAVHPDGNVHLGRPSAAEMTATPIEDYWLADLQAWPVGDEGAIVSYAAEVDVRNQPCSGRFQFIVGEVHHATSLK